MSPCLAGREESEFVTMVTDSDFKLFLFSKQNIQIFPHL